MKKIYGVILTMASALAFGFMPIFAKIAYDEGATPETTLFLRFFLSALMLFLYFIIARKNFKIPKEMYPKVLIIGMVGYGGTCMTLFSSYKYISVGLATILHFIYPAVVTIMEVLIYKEKIRVNKVLSLVFSIAGVYTLIGLSSMKLNAVGVFLALFSGVFYSICILQLGHSSVRKIDTIVITFYLSLFSSLSILIYGAFTGGLNFNIGPVGYLASLGLSGICTVAAFIALNMGVRIIGSSNAAILSTLEPITGMLLSALIFGESITMSVAIGSILILISVYMVLKKD